MRYSISDTAEYGDLTRGPRVIDDDVRETMARDPRRDPERRVRARVDPREPGQPPRVQRPQRQGKEHLIETVGKELRGMMSWIDEGGLDIDV